MIKAQQEMTCLNLAGAWAYALDPNDIGHQEGWSGDLTPYEEGTVQLPGTLAENGIGDERVWGDEMNRETVRSLRPRYSYVGKAWYAKEVLVPEAWTGRHMVLFIERVMVQSTLWVNGHLAGEQDSLSVPHRFDVTPFILPGGTNRIMICIDNRDIHRLGQHPSAYTDETQTIWNGMIGRIEMQAMHPIYLQEMRIFPDMHNSRIKVTGMWTNTTASHAEVSSRLSVRSLECSEWLQTNSDPYESTLPPYSSVPFEWFCDMQEDHVQPWDEFSPHLYEMNVESTVTTPAESTKIEQKQRFGMRSFTAVGTHFAINGRPAFLRGTLECCIFPLTGYPPTDLSVWLRLFQIVKDYGLNHVRFHSWCPPEAAFDAADQLGIYVQAEGPAWLDTWNTPVGAHPEHYDYLPKEAGRIIHEYGNHPSFCLFSNGNELNGDFHLLHRIIAELKANDDRRVYTLTSNWDRPLDPADDLFCAQTVDGIGARGQYFPDALSDATMLDFREAVAQRNVPLLSHEIGQYAVYPDVEEIHKYTGVLRPVNLEAIRADLERKGMLGDIKKFVYGSGMLALQLYREEIEAALRTPGQGGFQLLDLHDFPGQSTATVGVLNAFWESKGLIEPEQFRTFCNETVLLLKMPKRIFTHGEAFSAQVCIAHFGPQVLRSSEWTWSIANEQGEVLDHGVIHTSDIGQGSGIPIGSISSNAFHKVKTSVRLTVLIQSKGGTIRNEWPIWVFSDSEEETARDQTNIWITDVWNEETEQRLADGGSVLYTVNAEAHHTFPGKFIPVFWSPVHFATEDPCGIYVDEHHPVFASFPTKSYAEHHWKELLDRSVSLCLDEFPGSAELIVQVIPNFYHNRKLTNLFECRVGPGKLMVCGIDIVNDLGARPTAKQLRRSIASYMSGDAFQPNNSAATADLQQLLQTKLDFQNGDQL
ncbi:sugar-binding domain-containing protein [Paenibacillus sp. JJ-223]|uniref:sugar-binding domain-containing protein n=1 Tax=Paenibacillus sp. JJ-223 TaxID=2905647 RepID=UPI001F1EF479|nr:sugar-binding domain-containing protein [Paenibacillus sp. JJ-223]CAH1199234.1 Beta-galactosidase [Paenibacillus sp. JJ-223]